MSTDRRIGDPHVRKDVTGRETECPNGGAVERARSPERKKERDQINEFVILREIPPTLWPHIPVKWDTRPDSLRFYSDTPHTVDTTCLHLEEDVDLSLLNIVLSPWFKLDCRNPWEVGSASKLVRALGRWLAGYPVAPSYVEMRDGRLCLEGNHRLRAAYFAGYRSAPLLMPASQSEQILSMIEAARF